MKLTLWQQFSSNHSASYTVVGVFPSSSAAREAGDKIRQMVVEIARWSEEHRNILWGKEYWHPSPVEEQYAREYHVDWKEPIDWLRPFNYAFVVPYQREPIEHVIIFDQFVMVDAPGSLTWQTGHQFDNMLRAMGAKIYSEVFNGVAPDEEDIYKAVEFNLFCTAPNENVARELYQQLKTHVENHDSLAFETWLPIPWINFHPRYQQWTKNMSLQEFRQLEQTWIKEHQAWAHYVKSVSPNKIDQEKSKEYLKQDAALDLAIDFLRRSTSLGRDVICQLEGTTVELKGLSTGIAEKLPTLSAWMQSHGCTVKYELVQKD